VALVSVAAGAHAQSLEVLVDVQTALDKNKAVPPGPAGQSLVPKPPEEGIRALDELIERCQSEKGIAIEEGLSGGARFRTAVMLDPQKVKDLVRAHPERLTAGLRDAIVARCVASYQAPPQSRPSRGIFYFGEAVRRVAGGPMPEPVARVQQGLGVVLLEAIAERNRDGRARAFAAVLRGQTREREGDLAGALREYEQAYRAFEAGRDQAWRAACLNNLGAVYAARGEYGRAAEFLRAAEALGAPVVAADHPLIATCRENLGAAYARRGDDQKAETYLQDALAIWRRPPGENDPKIVAVLVGLSDVHSRQRKRDRALNELREARKIWDDLLLKYRPGLGDKVAMIPSDLGTDMAKAERDFPALTALHKFFADDASPIAAILDRIGDVHNGAGRHAEALEEYRRALEERRKIRGDLHPDVALSHHKIASVYEGQGKGAEAREEMRKAVFALRVAPGAPGADVDALKADDLVPLPITSEVLYDYGRGLERSFGGLPTVAQLRECAHLYGLSAGVLDRVRSDILQTEASKVLLGADRYDLIARRVGVFRKLFAAEGKAEDLRAAFEAAEQGLARVFLEQLGRSRAEVIGKISRPLRDRETELLDRLRRLDAEIVREQGKPRDQQDAERLAQLFDGRREAEREQRDLVARMERENPQYAALKYPRPCSVEQARSCLAPDEVALLYVPGSEASYLIVVARDADPRSERIAVLELASAGKIAEIVEQVTRQGALAISRGYLDPADRPPAMDLRALGPLAYRMLLEPAAGSIRGKGLVIVPGGALGYLPFELMVESGRPLVAGHRIRYAPSMTTLHYTRRWNEARTPPDRALLAVGDPTPQGLRAAFEPLPGSRAEVELIRDLLRASPDDILLGAAATEEAVKERSVNGSLARYRYVHFATHGRMGIADGDQPALVLSGDGRGEDDLLQLDEVTALRLNADLVVLSACETGRGRLDEAEGVRGLARAFLAAGCRGVLCTLWKIDDRATSSLMADVYAGIEKQQSPAEALREAQLRMIADGKPPLNWAPFILIGE
jgi:tetratricopeptide (TPR) repeat protein